jgi:hypothetical protein
MPAPEASLNLGNTVVKLRWEEPNASSGIDHKTQGVIPKGVYRGFTPVAQVGTFFLDLVPDAAAGDSVAVFEATAQTVADGGAPAFNPTAGFNLTVFTPSTVTIDLAAVTQNVSRILVFRVQYNEGNNFSTEAFVRVIAAADLQPTDVIIAQFTIPPGSLNLDTTIFVPGEDARTLLPPFVTVGDGFESRGDFTGNRPNLAGSDTSDVITAAANALFARSSILGTTTPGTIFVKRGDYTISATIPLRRGMALVGEDRNVSLLRQGGGATRIFDFDVADPTKSQLIRVEQVTLHESVGMIFQPLVRMFGASDVLIRDVLVDQIDLIVPIQILGASADCAVRDVRRVSAPPTANTVQLDGTSTRCRIEGSPLNILQSGTTSQNEITTSRVTHPGAMAIDGTILTDTRVALGAVRDLRLGAVTQYLRGYIQGMDIKATVVPSIGPGVVFVTDGVIEIDGMLYELTTSTDISATGAYAANIYTYFYARRNTATGALEFVGLSGNANHPEYSTAQNAWVRSGTGTGGVPTQRYIGCVLSLIAGAGAYQASIKVGDFVFLDASDGVVGTVNPITVVLPAMSSGTPTVSVPLVLSGLPLVESSRGGLLGGGTDFVVGGLDCMIDFEVRVAYAGTAQNNKVCTLTIGGPYTQRTSLAANFIQQTGVPASPAIIAHRFPSVRALARVRSSTTSLFLAAPDLTIRATISGLSAGPAETAVATVLAYQRGFVDAR